MLLEDIADISSCVALGHVAWVLKGFLIAFLTRTSWFKWSIMYSLLSGHRFSVPSFINVSEHSPVCRKCFRERISSPERVQDFWLMVQNILLNTNYIMIGI